MGLFNDDFEDGVKARTDSPVVFIDPNDFDGIDADFSNLNNPKPADPKDITAEHISNLKDSLESQSPGITDDMDDQQLRDLILNSFNRGPHVEKVDNDGTQIAIITKLHDSLDNKDALVSFMSGGQLDGDDVSASLDDIKFYIGAHEGGHVDNDILVEELEGMTNQERGEYIYSTPSARTTILNDETNADISALKLLKEERGVDFTDDLKSIRTVTAPMDDKHATAIHLDDGPLVVTPDQGEASRDFFNTMHLGVAKELGITSEEATVLQVTDRDKYNETVDKLLDEGFYSLDINGDANPAIEEYIRAHREEEIKQQELEEQQRLEEQTNSESQINLETEQLAQEEQELEEQELAQQEVEQQEIEQQELAQQEQDQQLQQEQDAALANDTSMAVSAPNLLAVTNVITTPSSDSLAGIVPLGAGVAMVHGDDIADKSSIEAGGEPVGEYFDGAANETAALDRIQQAQDMQNAMANAPAPTDPNISNPIGGMSAPAAPTAPA